MLQSRYILMMIVLLCASCQSDEKASLPPKTAQAKETPAKVTTTKEPATKLATNDEIRLSGQVASLNKATIGFQTAGIISRVSARAGMVFKKGQVLASLDDRDYVLRERMAKLQYEQALNQKTLAERDFNIEKELRQSDINSPMQLENSQISYKNALIHAEIAKTNWEIAQKNLHETQLRAPYDCVVVKQIKFAGESTTGPADSEGIFEVSEVGLPEFYFYAPESLLSRIKIGDSLEIFFPALKVRLPAKIVRYVPVVSDSTRQFLIVAQLNKTDKRIVSGYFIEGLLPLKAN